VLQYFWIFDEIFSSFQTRQVFVLNRRFEDRLGRHHHHHHHQGSDPRNVSSIQTPDAADSPKNFIEFNRRESSRTYGVVSRSFRIGRLKREMQMVQLSAIKCSRIAIW
jgi:hypothetical protein